MPADQQTLDTPAAPPPGHAPRIIAVIGAGFSGTMAAIHLRRQLPPDYVIYLLERTGRFARGLAYAASGTPHLLNVRAANMSAFPDDPGHFERWVEQAYRNFPTEITRTQAGVFATRRLYGKYLRALLYQEMKASGGQVRLLADDVVGLHPVPEGWRIDCSSGHEIAAAGVILASGNLPSNRPCDGVIFHDPWTESTLADLHPDAPILIVGTGLTMVDLTLALYGKGFRGPIIALSRRGLLPQRHVAVGQAWPAPNPNFKERTSALALLRRIRAEIRAAKAQNIGWRAVIDSLRPITTQLWLGLPLPEKQRFLRHLRPYWDVHRHRMAPPAGKIFDTLLESGTLQLKRGRVRDIKTFDGHAAVTLHNHATGALETLNVQRVTFATGLEGIRAGTGLIARLLATGLVRTDPLGLGLDVSRALEVIDAHGAPTPNLWAIGPLVRGVFWECLAVPDIRVQAQQLGATVAQMRQRASGSGR
jgi:uncharacterized NAD(P)/FAD-binding protein YdhS